MPSSVPARCLRLRLAAIVASTLTTALSFASLASAAGTYDLKTTYQGDTFFNGWDYYGHYDNLTNGDVNYVNQSTTLTYINDAGNAIVKVDNISVVPYNEKRDTVRITTKETYGIGSVWIFEALHTPYGCSVWPAFWSQGENWPAGGEIDTFEGVNLQSTNQMAMHTEAGCTASGTQTGQLTYANCDAQANSNSGCTVVEQAPNSYGAALAAAGGGIWATELAPDGVSIWFWSRSDAPSEVSSSSVSSIDTSAWGTPSAFYSSSTCSTPQFFAPQHLILTITLCGDWAGTPTVFNQTCSGTCYVDYVLNATNYDEAYFEIPSIRVFQNDSVVQQYLNSNTAAAATSATGTSSSVGTNSAIASGTSTAPTSGSSVAHGSVGNLLASIIALALIGLA